MRFAVGGKPWEGQLDLPYTIRQPLHAPRLIAGLECGRDRDSAARRHLRDVCGDHHERVSRIPERRDEDLQHLEPLRGKCTIVAGRFNLLENTVDKNLLLHLEFRVLGVRGFPRIAKSLPRAAVERRALLVLLVPLLQWNIQLKSLAGKTFAGIQEELGRYDLVFGGHAPLSQQMPKGVLMRHHTSPSDAGTARWLPRPSGRSLL